MTAQPPRGDGTTVGRSYDWWRRGDELRTLILSVGLQRWVLRPGRILVRHQCFQLSLALFRVQYLLEVAHEQLPQVP